MKKRREFEYKLRRKTKEKKDFLFYIEVVDAFDFRDAKFGFLATRHPRHPSLLAGLHILARSKSSC